MAGMLLKVINGRRGKRKVVARPSAAARRAKAKRNPSRQQVREAMKRGVKRVSAAKRVRRARRNLRHTSLSMKASNKGASRYVVAKSGPVRKARREKYNAKHALRRTYGKSNPARRYFPAVKRARAAVTKAANKSGTYSFGSLPKVNPRKRAKSGAGAKQMARKRGKLKGKEKAKFLRRMAAGRRKAGLSSGRKVLRHRKHRAKKNGVHKVRRHRKHRAKRNPHVRHIRRRRHAKRNGIESAPMRRGKKRGKRSGGVRRRRPSGSNKLVRSLSQAIGRLTGGERRHKSKRGKHRGIGVTARKMALQARRRVARGGPGVSAKARAYLKVHGLTKVNGGYGAVMDGFKALPKALPEVLLGGLALTGVGALGNYLGQKVVEKYGASYAPWAAPVISILGAVAGFLGLRAMKKPEWSNAWLVGGTGGALVNLYASNHVKAVGTAPALSLGRTLMLPIGSVVSRSSTTQLGDFDPRQRQRLAQGEVVTRAMTVGEVVTRAEAVNSLGETSEAQLNRLLGEITLDDDSSHGF